MIGVDLDRNPFRDPIRGQIEAARPRLRSRDRLLLNELVEPRFRLGAPRRVLAAGS